MTGQEEMRTRLAEHAHDRWAKWLAYMMRKAKQGPLYGSPGHYLNSLLFPSVLLEQWKRQMETPYSELPLNEQTSDLKIADEILTVLNEALHPLPELMGDLKAAASDPDADEKTLHEAIETFVRGVEESV